MNALGQWNGEPRAVVVRERQRDGLELQRVTCEVDAHGTHSGPRVVLRLLGSRCDVGDHGVVRVATQPGTRLRVVAWVADEPDGAA